MLIYSSLPLRVSFLASKQFPVSSFTVSGDRTKSIKVQYKKSYSCRSFSIRDRYIPSHIVRIGSATGISVSQRVVADPWKMNLKQLATTRMMEMQNPTTLYPKIASEYLSLTMMNSNPFWIIQYFFQSLFPTSAYIRTSVQEEVRTWRPLLLSRRRALLYIPGIRKACCPARVFLNQGMSSYGMMQVLRVQIGVVDVNFLVNLRVMMSSQMDSWGSSRSFSCDPSDISQQESLYDSRLTFWIHYSSMLQFSMTSWIFLVRSDSSGVEILLIWLFTYRGQMLLLFMLREIQTDPPMMGLACARGFRVENSTRGPNSRMMMIISRGSPISTFFHHSILFPITFPCKNRALHFATNNLPNKSSNLIQSNSLITVLVTNQSEKTLNSKTKGTALNPMQMNPLYQVYLSMNPLDILLIPCLTCRAERRKQKLQMNPKMKMQVFPPSGVWNRNMQLRRKIEAMRTACLMMRDISQSLLWKERMERNRSMSMSRSWISIQTTIPPLNWLYQIMEQNARSFLMNIFSQKMKEQIRQMSWMVVRRKEQSMPVLSWERPKMFQKTPQDQVSESYARRVQSCCFHYYQDGGILSRLRIRQVFIDSTQSMDSLQSPMDWRRSTWIGRTIRSKNYITKDP